VGRVTCCRVNNFGRRAFYVVSNSLPDYLRLYVIHRLAKTLLSDHLRHTCLRCSPEHVSASEALRNALYKFSTYLFTYLVGYALEFMRVARIVRE